MKSKTIRVIKSFVCSDALMPEVGTLGKTYDNPNGLMNCRFSPPYKTSFGKTVLPREEGDEVIVYFLPDEIEFLNDESDRP